MQQGGGLAVGPRHPRTVSACPIGEGHLAQLHPSQNPLITHLHPLSRSRLTFRTCLRLCDTYVAESDQLFFLGLVALALLEMSALVASKIAGQNSQNWTPIGLMS